MRILRGLAVLLGVCAALVLALVVIFTQPAPLVSAPTPPQPADVAAVRQLVRDLRAAANDAGTATVEADAAQLNSLIRLGARFVRGFRGEVVVAETAVIASAAVPVPWPLGRRWLNLTATVPPFAEGLTVDQVAVGGVDLPPRVALWLARQGGNLIVGNGFGDTVLTAASAMRIADRRLAFDIAMSEVGKNGVMRGVFGSLRGQAMPLPDEIDRYYTEIRQAMDAGTLPVTGSFLPYITFTLEMALANSTPETLPNTYTAAVFALAKACGARDFAMIVGGLAFDTGAGKGEFATVCDEVTFNDRIDSRRHFITSAALQAASNQGFSVSVGEFKELYDSVKAGGFDFTDLSANISGIAMSDYLMAQPRSAWRGILRRIGQERDVIIAFDGIPAIMPEAAFRARFGDVDSPAYQAMLTEIRARIARLALYAETGEQG